MFLISLHYVPEDSHDEYWYLINEFVFFIFWNSVNKCPYDDVNLEKKNEENLNEVVNAYIFAWWIMLYLGP